jgi:hypothetical protein
MFWKTGEYDLDGHKIPIYKENKRMPVSKPVYNARQWASAQEQGVITTVSGIKVLGEFDGKLLVENDGNIWILKDDGFHIVPFLRTDIKVQWHK